MMAAVGWPWSVWCGKLSAGLSTHSGSQSWLTVRCPQTLSVITWLFVKSTISWASTSEQQTCKTSGIPIYMQHDVNDASWCCSMWQACLPQTD